jgi:cell division cycle protein 37
MPLNYSKWDNLEISDDSDIETHPNVDKASMVRWKQRDIHDKREQRKLQIAKLNSELSLNGVLRPRIETVIAGVEDKGVAHYRAVQRRIKEQPSDEKPATNAPNQPTYDMMLGQLLSDVWREAAWLIDGNAKVVNGGVFINGKAVDEKTGEPSWAQEAVVPEAKSEMMGQALVERLKHHVQLLIKRDAEVKKEIAHEEAEQAKKITSEGIHEGFSSSHLTKAAPSPLDKVKPPAQTAQQKKKDTVQAIEVLNPGSVSCQLT